MLYEKIINDEYFKDTYSKIEEMKKDFPVNHGFIHINNVIEYAKKIADFFNLSKQDKELLLIACSLHDIGYLSGRDDHAYNGAILAKEYLNNIRLIDEDEIERVCKAIKDHGGKKVDEYLDDLSFYMILADKLDFSKTRYANDVIKYPKVKQFLKINRIVLEKDEEINLVVYTESDFCIDSTNEGYFEKLSAILSLINKARNLKINIKFIKE